MGALTERLKMHKEGEGYLRDSRKRTTRQRDGDVERDKVGRETTVHLHEDAIVGARVEWVTHLGNAFRLHRNLLFFVVVPV